MDKLGVKACITIFIKKNVVLGLTLFNAFKTGAIGGAHAQLELEKDKQELFWVLLAISKHKRDDKESMEKFTTLLSLT